MPTSELTIYSLANIFQMGLLVALIAVLLFRRTSNAKSYAPYRRAKNCLVGMFVLVFADLLLSLIINYLSLDDFADTVVDVLLYTPTAILFTWYCSWLISENQNYKLRIVFDVAIWLISLLAIAVSFSFPDNSAAQIVGWFFLTFWGVFFAHMAYRIVMSFRNVSNGIKSYYSSDAANGLRQLGRGILTFTCFGIVAPIATLLPPSFNSLYITVGGVAYIVLTVTLINHYDNFETIDRVLRLKTVIDGQKDISPNDISQIQWLMTDWEGKHGFRKKDITIDDMANDIGRTIGSLAATINVTHQCSFHDYINRLRIRDAQTMLVHNPEKPIDEIARTVGFKNESEMAKHFDIFANVSPSDWRNGVLKLMR
ncbi:MAG: AraC family transcriptional regulator [Bacteroidales bacterium]|nr:AraC family transcriptional regulator [Bacteroidales bacterium]